MGGAEKEKSKNKLNKNKNTIKSERKGCVMTANVVVVQTFCCVILRDIVVRTKAERCRKPICTENLHIGQSAKGLPVAYGFFFFL